ncbi:MAG: MoaD/ThiS family protein [Chloroflexi bacterium]|nr:MoaD/ThiS family protein [Chloroflexota bacterium]
MSIDAADGQVRVRVLQLGRRVLTHVGAPGLTVGSALDGVGLAGTSGLDIRVNGSSADAATPLRDGDVVTLIPRIKGGRGEW